VDSGHQPPARASARASPPPPATAHHASRRHRPAREPRVAVELRGWGKPKQDVLIDDHETTGLRIVFRQWPVGYDPLSKGEKPYQTPAPSDKSVHGKLALPPLKDPTPHKNGDGAH
jgi:hypothetical protein